jgi:uncharacterized protein YkwD
MLLSRLVAAVLLGLLALAAAMPAAGATDEAFGSRQPSLSSPERVLLRTINDVRRSHGLAPLKLDARLERAARAHSKDMLERDYFDHGAFGQRLSSFGVRGMVIGENIAWWPGYEARVNLIVRLWLRSPGHRANLLEGSFQRIGVAAIAGQLEGHGVVRMITADFAGR